MALKTDVGDVVKKALNGEMLAREEIAALVEVPPHTPESGRVMAAADRMCRLACDGKAEIHGQIGIDLSPCSTNCSFCAFAAKNGVFTEKEELPVEKVVEIARRAESNGANGIFVMSTGAYDFGKFITISQHIRDSLRTDATMIANVGDFDADQARRLKDAGYAGIYHAVRMGEGEVTGIRPERRLETVRNAREAGLKVGTCVEPVGPEHSTEEIVEKTLIGRNMDPCYSGAMRRITIPGSELAQHGMLSEYRGAYLVAVVRLAMGPDVPGNCTHEPNLLGATAGANLFWAEVGSNPRDTEAETSAGRGKDVPACRDMFQETDYELLQGASAIYGEAG